MTSQSASPAATSQKVALWLALSLSTSLGAPGCGLRSIKSEQPDQATQPAVITADDSGDDALDRHELAAAAYAAGLDAEAAGQTAAAAACYRRALGYDPDSVIAHSRLGLLLMATDGAHAEAASHLERAETLGAREFAIHQSLATYYLELNKKELAAREFERLLTCRETTADRERFEPIALRLAHYLTSYYADANQPADAARIYGALIQTFPERAELRLERAKLLLAARQEAAARADVIAFEKLRTKSPAGARLLAVHFSRIGNDAEALLETDRAIARLVAGGDPEETPSSLTAMRHFRAELLIRLQRTDEAQKELDALLAAAKTPGERVDAVVAIAQLERLGPDTANAEKRLRAAIASGLTSPRLHAALAETLTIAERRAEAVESWRRAADLAPTETYYRLALASALANCGRPPAAAAELRAILEFQPANADALNMLAFLYAQEDINLDEAAELATKALAVDPANPHYLDTLAWVRYRQGRIEEALGILERAAMASQEATIYDHLGDACYALGLNHRAEIAWKRALKLDKRMPGIPSKLKRLAPAK